MTGKWTLELLMLAIITNGLVLGCLEEFQIHSDNGSISVKEYPNNEREIINVTITCCLISSIYEYNYKFGHLNVPQTLIIPYLKISQLPVFPNLTGITEIKFIESHDKVVRAGAFKNLPKLKKIDFVVNRLTKIPNIKLGGVGTLENLILSYNEIKEVDVVLDAEKIDLHYNLIRKITGQFENVKVLHLSGTPLEIMKKSYFKHPEKLEKLNLAYNSISRIDPDSFWNMTNLEELNLSFNRITDMELGLFSSLRKLITLFLNGNKIENLKVGIFENLVSLKILHLEENRLKNLNQEVLKPMSNLRKLYFNQNEISSWDLKNIKKYCPHLDIVKMNDNKWKCQDLDVIVGDLRNQNIYLLDSTFDMWLNFPYPHPRALLRCID